MSVREKRWPVAVGLLLTIVLALVLEAVFFGYLVDDSFISYRYAENLIAGNGLVFNPGERVEGYSNFLWVMILAGLTSTGLSPIMASKILGVLFSIGTILILFLLSKKLSARSGLFILTSVFLTATDIGFIRWSVAGMETQLAAFLLMAALFFLVRETEKDSGFPTSSLMLGLFSLARPEGPALFVAALAWKLWRIRRRWSGRDTAWVLAYLLIVIPQIVFRASYYGFLLPNSYYAKTAGGLKQILVGVAYANKFFSSRGGFLLLPLITLPFIRGRSKLSLLYPFLIACLFFIVYVGGDHMDDFRFFVPILPVIFLLAQEGFAELAAVTGRLKGWVVTVFLVAFALSNLVGDYFETSVVWWGNVRGELNQLKTEVMTPEKFYDRAQVGVWLKENVSPDKIVAVEDCGMIPYYSRLRAIDMFGLMDTHLAHLRGMLHRKFDVSYVLDRKPDIIVLIRYPQWAGGEPHWQSNVDRLLVASERFKSEYSLVQRMNCDTRWFLIFGRREGPGVHGL
jgi:hypothetical protein